MRAVPTTKRRCIAGALIVVATLLLSFAPAYAATRTFFEGSAANNSWKSYAYHETTTGGSVQTDSFQYATVYFQTFTCYGPSACPTILYSSSSGGGAGGLQHTAVTARSRCKFSYGTQSFSHGMTCKRFEP